MDEPLSRDERALQVGIGQGGRLSRRTFVRVVGASAGGVLLSSCTSGGDGEEEAPNGAAANGTDGGQGTAPAVSDPERASEIFVKSDEGLYKVFGTELGTRWLDETSFVTPVEHFYVRSRYPTPVIEPDDWRLQVTGDAIEEPFELTYDELVELPSRQAPRVMECFGNGRTINWEQLGYDVAGGNWGFSAASQGEWVYVPISVILERARPTSDAVQLLFWSGVDGPDTGRPMPMEEILSRADVIGLAYRLNGLPLAPDHGGPVRAIVPGWGGAASIKWLTEINISSHRFWTRMHTREEALIGPDYDVDEASPDDEFLGATEDDIRGETATWLKVNSWLTLPLVMRESDPPGDYDLQPGEVPTLSPGEHTMRGYAKAASGIERVDYSVDEGRTWQEATLVPPSDLEYSWVRFEFPWDARPGTHVLMTRATDREGSTQPETVPFNELGILCNAIPKFEVEVV